MKLTKSYTHLWHHVMLITCFQHFFNMHNYILNEIHIFTPTFMRSVPKVCIEFNKKKEYISRFQLYNMFSGCENVCGCVF